MQKYGKLPGIPKPGRLGMMESLEDVELEEGEDAAAERAGAEAEDERKFQRKMLTTLIWKT